MFNILRDYQTVAQSDCILHSYHFVSYQRQLCLNQGHEVLFFKLLISFTLTFKPMIHFDFIFCLWCKEEVQLFFFFFAHGYLIFLTPCVERGIFPVGLSWHYFWFIQLWNFLPLVDSAADSTRPGMFFKESHSLIFNHSLVCCLPSTLAPGKMLQLLCGITIGCLVMFLKPWK